MADLERIKFPDHLNEHNLTAQQLAILTPEQQAIAKDWNVLTRKMDWVIEQQVMSYNILVKHDDLLELWRKVVWLGILVGGSGGILAVLVRFIK